MSKGAEALRKELNCGSSLGTASYNAMQDAKIDAAVAPLVEALRNFLEYDAASEGDVSMTDNDELWQKAETALEQWRTGR